MPNSAWHNHIPTTRSYNTSIQAYKDPRYTSTKTSSIQAYKHKSYKHTSTKTNKNYNNHTNTKTNIRSSNNIHEMKYLLKSELVRTVARSEWISACWLLLLLLLLLLSSPTPNVDIIVCIGTVWRGAKYALDRCSTWCDDLTRYRTVICTGSNWLGHYEMVIRTLQQSPKSLPNI